MRYRLVHAEKMKIDSLFEKADVCSKDLEVLAHWAQYICVRVCGLLEICIQTLLSQYARDKAHKNVARFVESKLRRFNNTGTERILGLVSDFSPRWRRTLQEYLEGERKDALDSLRANRNRIAHGESVSVTLPQVQSWYRRALEVLAFIENELI